VPSYTHQPWLLRWRDVDPRRIAFDPTPARDIAQRARAQRPPIATDEDGDDDALEAEIDHALLAAYGGWAAGWNWASRASSTASPIRWARSMPTGPAPRDCGHTRWPASPAHG